MAQYTYRMNHRPITDFTGITGWLEKMAAKGWMLDFCGTLFWKFRKIEPRQVHFSAIYLPIDCNAFSPVRTPEVEELEELCAGTGWYWVSSMYQLQIFANEEADPAPLDSDPVVQVESLHRAMMQNVLPSNIILLVIAGVMALFCWSSIFTGNFYSNIGFGHWLAAFIFTIVILMVLGELAIYYIWHKRAKEDAQSGFLRPTRSFPGLMTVFLAVLLVVYVLWVCALPWQSQLTALSSLFIFILVRGFANLGRKNEKLSSWANIAVIAFLGLWVVLFPVISISIRNQIEASTHHPQSVVLYEGREYTLNRDEIPLKTEDLMEIDPDLQNYTCEIESFFPCRITHNTQHHLYGNTGTPMLHYTIWDYPLPLYRDYFLDQAINEEFYPTHGELDPEVWEAEAVYRLQQNGQPQNVYVICWEGRIVSLHIRLETENPELTAEQIATIVEKLKP